MLGTKQYKQNVKKYLKKYKYNAITIQTMLETIQNNTSNNGLNIPELVSVCALLAQIAPIWRTGAHAQALKQSSVYLKAH